MLTQRQSNDLKRPIPTAQKLEWREAYLKKLSHTVPILYGEESKPFLESGNRKTGSSGSIFKSVFVWNLPSIATCPGFTSWCARNCYNADPRKEVFPIAKWSENWWWAVNSPGRLRREILDVLSLAVKPCAVRLHSSGDFYSNDYIKLWISIVKSSPDVKFWTYTRSWCIESLSRALDELKSLENIEVFASWDSNMTEPPKAWRKSLVFDEHEKLMNEAKLGKSSLVICPEQFSKVENCASCGECIFRNQRDVAFIVH